MEKQQPRSLQGAPTQKGSKEETFAALAFTYGFTHEVTTFFIKGPMESLEDFCYYFADEEEINTCVTAILKPEATIPEEPEEEPDSVLETEGDSKQILEQISRVRQAWQAIRKLKHGSMAAWQHGELPLRIENLQTVDQIAHQARNRIIDQQSLWRFKAQFWERYKTVYPADAYPSDLLLHRCRSEIEDRLLTNYDIRGTETAANQIKTTKVGPPATHGSAHSIDDHMAKLRTYLLAIAIIGTDKVQGAPSDEGFGSDSTKFVKIPWDTLQAYYFRAARAIKPVPKAIQLDWLETKDSEERAVWVSRFRNGNETLGEVVKAVMEIRAANWTYAGGTASIQGQCTETLHLCSDARGQNHLSPCSPRPERHPLANSQTAGSAEDFSEDIQMPRLEEENSSAQEGRAPQPNGGEPPEEAMSTIRRGITESFARHQDLSTPRQEESRPLPPSRSANKRRCMNILRRLHENDEEVATTICTEEEVHRLRAAKPGGLWWATTKWIKPIQLKRSSKR